MRDQTHYFLTAFLQPVAPIFNVIVIMVNQMACRLSQ